MLHTQLSSLTQRNSTVTNFKHKLLTSTSELNNLHIKELTTGSNEKHNHLILKMNETHALTIFKNGLNDDLKNTRIRIDLSDSNFKIKFKQGNIKTNADAQSIPICLKH